LDAPWQLLDSWSGGGLPLGQCASGLLLVDPEAFPHFLFAGTTGSGKTRFGLRPLITAALADGWHVSIFDRAGVDFTPFRNHPNAVLTLLQDPADTIDYLGALYEVVEARFEWMRKVGANTWSRAPGRKPPRVLAVFDEFSNLADSLLGRQREELWRWARMVAAEGRKAGVHLALALQDPTYKSIDLRIRRNCMPLSFRVKDSEASRVVLGASGAESLPPRHFLAVLHDLTQAVAFAPDDDEIATFLANRRVPVYPRPDWLAR
jgi:DNA segregation ATPase FtsK/SpoIIIE-like protein